MAVERKRSQGHEGGNAPHGASRPRIEQGHPVKRSPLVASAIAAGSGGGSSGSCRG